MRGIKWTLCQGHFLKRDLETELFFNILVSWRQYDTKTLAVASESDAVASVFNLSSYIDIAYDFDNQITK